MLARRLVVAAAKEGHTAVGVELNPWLNLYARASAVCKISDPIYDAQKAQKHIKIAQNFSHVSESPSFSLPLMPIFTALGTGGISLKDCIFLGNVL